MKTDEMKDLDAIVTDAVAQYIEKPRSEEHPAELVQIPPR
jgi:hypothetical protein